jgi:hypothetical protein
VRVAVIHLEVAGLQGDVPHQRLEHGDVEGRVVDEQVPILHPRLVVMPRRQVRRERDADATRELRVEVEVGDGVVEARTDRHQAIGGTRRDGVGRVLVIEPLELLGERGTDLELRSVEGRGIVLRRLEHVDAARMPHAMREGCAGGPPSRTST